MSWGIMWPLLTDKEGDWYPAGLSDGDFRGLFGYKAGFPCHSFFAMNSLTLPQWMRCFYVALHCMYIPWYACESVLRPVQNFLAIAIFVADGAYNFVKIGILSLEASSFSPAIPVISS